MARRLCTIAAGKGYKDVVELLLANKADVNAKDNEGWTPLHVAAMNGHKDVAELLLANKADVNAKDNKGETPLHMVLALATDSRNKPETELGKRNQDMAELLRQQRRPRVICFVGDEVTSLTFSGFSIRDSSRRLLLEPKFPPRQAEFFPKLIEMSLSSQPLVIAGRTFRSRLIMGTGKFSSPEAMRDALAASGAELVTVALRRADLSGQRDPFANILEFIDPKKYLLLPNTSGAMNAEEAVRLARLAAAAGLPKWVKLEIHPDPRFLLPDPIETFRAAEILVKDGFTVLPYINADPVLAKRLQDIGVATVMPLGSPIGSNRGVQTRDQIRIIIEQATVPVVVDAGLGAPSHAAEAMEMGADAVLVNTAVAVSSDPNQMAVAFKMAVEAGRAALRSRAGRHAGNRQRDESADGIFGLIENR